VEIRYCDVCGGLVSAADAPAAEGDVGILCEVCLRTRRVLPDVVDAAARVEAKRASKLQRFRCPHCERRLRTKAVRARVEIACPKCEGMLVLLPGGGVEALVPARPAKAEQNLDRTSTSSRRSAERLRAGSGRTPPPLPPEEAAGLPDEPEEVEAADAIPVSPRSTGAQLPLEPIRASARIPSEEETEPVEAAASEGGTEELDEGETAEEESGEGAGAEDDAAEEGSDDEDAAEETSLGWESSDGEPATAPLEAIEDSDDAYGAAPGESGESEEQEGDLAFAAPARASRPLLVLALATILAGLGGAFAVRGPDAPAAARLEALGGRVGDAFARIEARVAVLRGRGAAPADGEAAPADREAPAGDDAPGDRR
jgi:Zn-finger nucleic acid-binding protein